MSDIPFISKKELEKLKKENAQERLVFIDQYVRWLKQTPNSVWSKQLRSLD